jgi:hypothetical protein
LGDDRHEGLFERRGARAKLRGRKRAIMAPLWRCEGDVRAKKGAR